MIISKLLHRHDDCTCRVEIDYTSRYHPNILQTILQATLVLS